MVSAPPVTRLEGSESARPRGSDTKEARARQTMQYDFSNAFESRNFSIVFNIIKVHVKHLDLILGQLIEKVSKLI